MDDRSCVALLRWALPRLGLEWEGFRKPRGQVCKRIARRMRELGVSDAGAYRSVLEGDPGEWRHLEGLCRVTISRFFRDRGVWRHLHAVALPELAERLLREGAGGGGAVDGPVLHAWSAGCGSGEEPYSLAILWWLGLPGVAGRVRLGVTATDAGQEVLARARRACYESGTLRQVPGGWRALAFTRRGASGSSGEVCLRRTFLRGVELLRQDVRRDMPPGPFQLVFCRNLVFTYFAPEVRERLLAGILARLSPGGRLVLGAHERLPPGNWPLARDASSEPVWRRVP